MFEIDDDTQVDGFEIDRAPGMRVGGFEVDEAAGPSVGGFEVAAPRVAGFETDEGVAYYAY